MSELWESMRHRRPDAHPVQRLHHSGGVFAINFRIFVLASVISRSLRFFAVATLIYFYGEPIRAFIERHLNWLTIVFVILLVGGFWPFGRGFGRASEAES